MDLYEHQARQLFAEHGIAVPEAEVIDRAADAKEAAGLPVAGSSSRRR